MERPEVAAILLALDACCDLSAATTDTVVTVAARLGAALEGLFVEDAELLRAAALPFSREVLGHGHERTLTPEDVRRMNRDLSAELEQRLARAARAHNVAWRYRTVEGSRWSAALDAAAGHDLFVPARRLRRAGGAPAATGFERVGVVLDEVLHEERVLALLTALAAGGTTREVLLVCRRAPTPGLLARLAEQRLRAYVHPGHEDDPLALLREVQAQGTGLLIAARQALARPGAPLRGLDALPMSLLLLH